MKDLKIKDSLIGRCGIYCGACRLYTLRRCESCLNIYPTVEEAKCPYYKCVITKGLRTCGECESFPCEHHYGPMAVYAKVYIDWKKKEIKETSSEE